jgi:hypothetical protein
VHLLIILGIIPPDLPANITKAATGQPAPTEVLFLDCSSTLGDKQTIKVSSHEGHCHNHMLKYGDLLGY